MSTETKTDERTPHAIRMQRMERGRQARSLRRIGPPFTASQRRRLEDALSIAVGAAMGLDEGRLGFIARHLAAQDDGRTPADAPKREGKLTAEQSEELKVLLEAVHRAVNASNCKLGSPLRNVAEHLLQQHKHTVEAIKLPDGSEARARREARGLAMRAAAPSMHGVMRKESMKAFVPPSADEQLRHDLKMDEEEYNDPLVVEARNAAKAAFVKYDVSKDGELSKEELFQVLMDAGHVNVGATPEAKQAWLTEQFNKADKDGSGAVDFPEFVLLYVEIAEHDEAEKAARDAFAKYDVSGDNKLERFELFQVLLDLGILIGDTKAEKEAFLEKEFKKADADGSEAVDFAEFVQFHIDVAKRSRRSVFKVQKAAMQQRREQRSLATTQFMQSDALMKVVQPESGIKYLSGRWLLKRAGYDPYEVERSGRKITKWQAKRDPTPLPCRQVLERDTPEAFITHEQLEAQYNKFKANLKETKGAEKDNIDAAPIVVTSHCWEERESPDPHGFTLKSIGNELGKQMGVFNSWGFDDVGVFFDWSCVYQDTVDVIRTPEQEKEAEKAIESMALLYAHRLTTVYLVTDQRHLDPPRNNRGWPFFEECLTKLFKEAPPPKRYRLPNGVGPTTMWQKVIRIGDDELGGLHQGPPLAPTRFLKEMANKVFSKPSDRNLLLSDYRKTISHGFSGLEKLKLARRGWNDADLAEFAVTLKEVECPQVVEMDLSANDMTAKGVEALGVAVKGGAIHSLESLNLSDCSGVTVLPANLAELKQLQVLKLDGCIGLGAIPDTFAKMAALKQLHICHCIKLINNTEALRVLPSTVKIVKEK